MNRFFIILSFNGSTFQGWQAQPGKVTIQGEIKSALKKILQEEICVIGAGRTDSGVHALNYVAHFDSEKLDKLDIIDIVYKLNRVLPYDIVIHDIIPCNSNAHSRFDAISRTYHYLISRTKNPFLDDFTLYYPHVLNIDLMNEAGKILLQNTDFTSFSKLHGNSKTNICDVREAEWRQVNPELIAFRITADRFLRNMVRAIVGTMIQIGSLKESASSMQRIIDEKDRSASGISVSGKGLFLTDIKYQNIQLPEKKNFLLNESFFF